MPTLDFPWHADCTPEELQDRADQLHDAVMQALRELASLRPESMAGYEAALAALGESL